MFEIIKHGPRLFEVRGRFTLRGRVGAGEGSQIVRSRQAATRLAADWTRIEIRAQFDLAEQRILRIQHAREYCARRAARSSNDQLTFEF